VVDTIPYGKQWIDEEDIKAVAEVLRSDWLTTGPMVEAFEKAISEYVGAKHAVAFSSGTAALHGAAYASKISKNDEVIVPPLTFAATANCVVYQGGTPIFVDVDADSLLIDHLLLKNKVNSKTKAVIAVDYAGQPCNYDALRAIAAENHLLLISDACHALGAKYRGQMVGSLADLTVFSFHPVKHITTGEGGMVVTDNEEYASRMRCFRNHGIQSDHRQRNKTGTWYYEMTDLGYNYRLTDIQCALGLSQLRRLPEWIQRRRDIAQMYDKAFANNTETKPLKVKADVFHVYHLYVITLSSKLKGHRSEIFSSLRNAGIGVNVHYIPVHLHPFYEKNFGTSSGSCPVAELAYESILSLPMFPKMTNQDVNRVIAEVENTLAKFK
jgi:perosamine synthetase